MTAKEARREAQRILNVVQDGSLGPKSRAAWEMLAAAPANSEWPPRPTVSAVHEVLASSFADPADIRAFEKCKAAGGTDEECFRKGDNGIGLWNDRTTEDRPMCALPRDDWQDFGNSARGRAVLVTCDGKSVICELRDTMPWKKNIRNKAGIDLNPAAWKALGFKPPQLRKATWQWV